MLSTIILERNDTTSNNILYITYTFLKSFFLISLTCLNSEEISLVNQDSMNIVQLFQPEPYFKPPWQSYSCIQWGLSHDLRHVSFLAKTNRCMKWFLKSEVEQGQKNPISWLSDCAFSFEPSTLTKSQQNKNWLINFSSLLDLALSSL